MNHIYIPQVEVERDKTRQIPTLILWVVFL